MATMRFAAPRLVESRGKRQARKEAKEMAQVIDHSVTPGDGDVLTYEAASGRYAPAATARVATVTLSSAEILALHTTAVELVPAPAAGHCLVPLTLLFVRAAGAGYAPAAPPTYLVVGYGPTPDFGAAWYVDAAPLGLTPPLTVLASTAGGVTSGQQGATTLDSSVYASPLTLAAGAALLGGDGTLEVTVHYLVV